MEIEGPSRAAYGSGQLSRPIKNQGYRPRPRRALCSLGLHVNHELMRVWEPRNVSCYGHRGLQKCLQEHQPWPSLKVYLFIASMLSSHGLRKSFKIA